MHVQGRRAEHACAGRSFHGLYRRPIIGPVSGGAGAMTDAPTQPAAGPGKRAVGPYQADAELIALVSRFLAEGIRSGDGIVVVARAAHRRAFATALDGAGVDVARARKAGRLLQQGVAQLLGHFPPRDQLNAGRFHSVMPLLTRLASAGGRPVRLLGEIVGTLRDRGHVTLAIELEALRDGIGALLPFALLCRYPANAPVGRGTAADVRNRCRLWSDVVIVTRAFPPGLDSVRAARHFAARLLGPGCDQELAQDTAIVVTELTANAVLHARSGFTLAICQSATSVRIAVRDGRPLTPRSDGRPFDVTAGHGLSVVAGLASDWAATPLPDGKVVWADLAVNRGDAQAAARADD